jgi:hypothetical protein
LPRDPPGLPDPGTLSVHWSLGALSLPIEDSRVYLMGAVLRLLELALNAVITNTWKFLPPEIAINQGQMHGNQYSSTLSPNWDSSEGCPSVSHHFPTESVALCGGTVSDMTP